MIQRNSPSSYTTCAAGLLALLLAQMNSVAAASSMSIAHDFHAEWAYVGGATIRGGGATFNSGEEQSTYVRYVLSPQVTNRLLAHFGAQWQRFSFGAPDPAPVPSTFQRISMVIGLDWQLTDQWLFRAEVQPGVYSDFRDVSWRDVNAPIFLGAVYLANPDLQWFLGLRLDLRSNYPVIPALGARWKFADEWTLNALLPRPRLEYERSERFIAYLGAGIEAGTFRMGDKFGYQQGWPDLNREILDYFEIRIGPGFSWKIRPNVSVEADAGYMVLRRFDFAGQDLVFRSDPAPYVRIASQLRF